MPLTRDFNKLVQKRIARDPAFADALRREGIDTMLSNDGGTDIGPVLNMQFVDSLIGYLEVRSWAFEKLCSNPIGSNLIDLKMHHYLYFTNLFSAIELVNDHVGDASARIAFEENFQKGFAAPGDYFYARELRNAIVHRGLDPAAQGVQKGQQVFAVSPPVVFHRDGKRAYVCTFPLLVDLAAACDTASNAAIHAVVEREGLLDPAAYMLDQTRVLAMIDAADHVPEWAQDMAEQAFATMDFGAMATELAQFRVQQLRSLLGQGRVAPKEIAER